jgi:dihydroorotate dehydrogenase (fumarate)
VRIFEQCKTVSATTLNFGCPNDLHGGRIMSFDLSGILDIMNALYGLKPIWIKFSPYSDPLQLKEVAQILNERGKGKVRAVVACNTFPNAFVSRDVITPNGGLAGLSGPAMKPIALGQVVQWRKHLIPEIDVIGVGGIMTGNDVVDFLDAGAAATQVCSLAFWSGNPSELGGRLIKDKTSGRFTQLLTDRA